MALKQFVLTPAAGKRLIAQALTRHPAVQTVLAKGTLVIVAGSTNGYVAEEILRAIGQAEGFSRAGFARGVVRPPGAPSETAPAAMDVIITDGQWQKEKTIFDVAGDLEAGDLILKGGNALDLPRRRAAVLVGHPQGGTIVSAMGAVFGRRVRMIVPIGLEKRVCQDLTDLTEQLNAPDAQGCRLVLLPGEAFTELDAIQLLAGATAHLAAAGGISGAEGAVWLAVSGDAAQLQSTETLLNAVASEPPCRL
jgi:hypothetical protein